MVSSRKGREKVTRQPRLREKLSNLPALFRKESPGKVLPGLLSQLSQRF
jgi:hypothetical protein